MNSSILRVKTILFMVSVAVLLSACGKPSDSGDSSKDSSGNDSSSNDSGGDEVVVEQLPAEEVKLPDIKLSGVTLDPKDVIAIIEIEKEFVSTDPLRIEGSRAPQGGYVEGTIDIGWFGDWENDVQPPRRMVVGLGTGASSYTDLIGGGEGPCNESNCCKHTYSWAIQYWYIGYFYADPACRLYGSITLEEWTEPVLVESTGPAIACAVQMPEIYAAQFQTMLLEFDFTPDSLMFLDINKGPMADATVMTELKNFPWEDGLCKVN